MTEGIVRITYFVHGTTVDNERGISSGWCDCELSEKGKAQSKALPGQVGDASFDVVFSSDLKRAVDSARISFKGVAPLRKDKRLRECNYGNLNGGASVKVDEMMRGCIDKPFPYGESYREVEMRIRGFLGDLCEKYVGKHVGIVAHRAPQLALDVILKGMMWEQAMDADWRLRKEWRPGWEYMLDCAALKGPAESGKAKEGKPR